MKRAEAVERAKSAIGKGVHYLLGAGGMHPDSPLPTDESSKCDCSGFVAWVFHYSRLQPQFQFLKLFNGGWMNTGGIIRDSQSSAGLWFDRGTGPAMVHAAAIGDVLVFNPGQGFRYGHCGVVTGPRRVTHCAASNKPDAIQETPFGVFDTHPLVHVVRFAGLED